MAASSTGVKCFHCDEPVSARELSDGWCDSCGKRLPSFLKPGPKGDAKAESPSAPASGTKPGPRPLWLLVGAGVLLAALATAVTAVFLIRPA